MSRKKDDIHNYQAIKDKVILEFLNSQSENTKKTYTSFFKRVLEFSKEESGQSMLEHSEQWSRKIFVLQQWLIQKQYSLCTVESTTGMLRGFFAFYKKPLDLSGADKRKLGRVARNSEDYAFVQSDLKKMYDVASLEERYVICLGSNFGLRATDAIGLTFGKYRAAFENAQNESIAPPIPLGTVNTGKENVIAHPFLTQDLIAVIQSILDTHKNAKDEDRVYTNQTSQLTSTLQNLVFKAGIDTHGQRVRFHNLRKYLYDKLVSVGSDSKAAQIIGHKIAGEIAPYIGVGSLRELYERAAPSIMLSNNGNGETKKKVIDLEQKVKDLEAENQKLRENQTSDKATQETKIQQLFTMIEELKAASGLNTAEILEIRKKRQEKT